MCVTALPARISCDLYCKDCVKLLQYFNPSILGIVQRLWVVLILIWVIWTALKGNDD